MNPYEIIISDTVDEMTIEVPSVPLTEVVIEGTTDVTTLDLNMYTDFFATKRSWANTLEYMTETEFNQLKGFYDRQWTLWQYPTLSIPDLDVNDVVVRMSITPRQIIDQCGTVNDVT